MTTGSIGRDQQLRAAAFAFLGSLASDGVPVVRQDDLMGFVFEGQPVRLMAPQQGIWKPRSFDAALSIRTVFTSDPSRRPYADEVGDDGFLRYKWRGEDPAHPDNRALRAAMDSAVPMIWFHGVASGTYYPVYPVRLVEEEPAHQQFVVAVDEESLWARRELVDRDPGLVRAYAERSTMARLHQPLFRHRVLTAYDYRCSLCNLRHQRLLDAAHVVPDAQGGEPVVTNGIAMCKIHHAAYDADIFGISPRYHVTVRHDVMEEIDGPTLRYTLQAINGASIELPRRKKARPDPEFLDIRWKQFLAAS